MRKAVYIKLVLCLALLSVLLLCCLGCGGKGVYYVGHKGTRVFHRPGCEYAPPKNASVLFMSGDKAQKEGYRSCSVCDPLGKKAEKAQAE